MKNNIKKFLICAFVSAVGVVSLMGDIEMNQPKHEVAIETKTRNLDSWESINNTAGAVKIIGESIVINTVADVVKNENTIVTSPKLEFTDGWTNTSVNIRKEPNIESEVLEVCKFNTKVSYSKYNENWSIIEYDNDYAYIYSKYISDTKCKYRTVSIPRYSGTKTWMPYTAITLRSSQQYKLQQIAYTGNYGIRMYDGRYCIAVGTGVTSNIGTYVDLVLANGTIIPCIVGDIKSDRHTNSSNLITVHSNCCSEFIVDKTQLNSKAKIMGDCSYIRKDWNSRVVQIKVYKTDVIK